MATRCGTVGATRLEHSPGFFASGPSRSEALLPSSHSLRQPACASMLPHLPCSRSSQSLLMRRTAEPPRRSSWHGRSDSLSLTAATHARCSLEEITPPSHSRRAPMPTSPADVLIRFLYTPLSKYIHSWTGSSCSAYAVPASLKPRRSSIILSRFVSLRFRCGPSAPG